MRWGLLLLGLRFGLCAGVRAFLSIAGGFLCCVFYSGLRSLGPGSVALAGLRVSALYCSALRFPEVLCIGGFVDLLFSERCLLGLTFFLSFPPPWPSCPAGLGSLI